MLCCVALAETLLQCVKYAGNGKNYAFRFGYVSVVYAENVRGANFRHNRVSLQINFRGSAEGTTILVGGSKGGLRGLKPTPNFF